MFSCGVITVSPYMFQFKNIFANDDYDNFTSPITLKFSGFMNPPFTTTAASFKVFTLDAYNNYIQYENETLAVNIDSETTDHPNSFLRFNGKCLSACPPGTYEHAPSSICQNCSEECQTCKGESTFCVTCDKKSDFPNFLKNSCVLDCPSGLAKGGKCMNCTSPCNTCTKSAKKCTTCIDDFLLASNKCLTKCPVGTYKSGVECKECPDKSCSECNE